LDQFPLTYIKGIGPNRAEVLAKEGLITLEDMLYYFPKSYLSRSTISTIRDLSSSLQKELAFSQISSEKLSNDFIMRSEITIIGEIHQKNEITFGKNRSMLKLIIKDGSGKNANIIFYNQAKYFEKIYQRGQILAISGKPEIDKYGITFAHPDIEIIEDEEITEYKEGRILPKYRLSETMVKVGISLKLLRKVMKTIIEKELNFIEETLPDNIIKDFGLPEIKKAILSLHFPEDERILAKAKYRIKLEELFFYQLNLGLAKTKQTQSETAPLINPKSKLARTVYDNLPFELTIDQKKVIREITNDLNSTSPMNRLLQGDVGSGKTIVALLTMLAAIENGYQVALMAPTEILAEQHYQSLKKFFSELNIEVVQLLGGQKVKLRREVKEKISTQEAKVIIGTHALFQAEIEYNKLAYVIIDEQHRFGVSQRADLKLSAKKSFGDENLSPHILVMTATPIPRTLTMSVYGDLDVSVIKSMPKNRKPISTKIWFDSKVETAYQFIKDEIHKGRQAYLVFPLVEISEKVEAKSAIEHYERLSATIFKDYRCGLLHGQMFWYEKEDVMKAFLNKEFDILISTTVIEVGIDVPNASVMMIENAERFGLSQLHQLRGRVGRGSEQSYCILMTKDHFEYQLKNKSIPLEEKKAALIRLKTMEDTTDGFQIAEVDLKLRGPGDMLGTKQAGLPEFKFADIVKDADIMQEARNLAQEILKNDPKLKSTENSIIRKFFIRQKKQGKGTFYDIA
jgi:ATP-dependent DNA helicase RecG